MQKINIKLIVTIFLVWISNFVFSNNTIDSLQNIIVNTEIDTISMRIYVEIGNEYFGEDNNLAINFYEKALEIAIAEKNENYEAKIYYKIGDIHQLTGSYNKSLEYFLKSVKIYSKLGDDYNIAICYIDMGNTNRILKSHQNAIKYYYDAIEIGEKIKSKFIIAYAHNNLANSQVAFGLLDEALVNYQKALKIYEEIKNINKQAGVIANIGLLYSDQAKIEEDIELKQIKLQDAIAYLERSKEMSIALNDKSLETDLLFYLADVNLLIAESFQREIDKQEIYRLAIEQAEESLMLAREIEVIPYQINAYKVLYQASIKIGKEDDALYYFEKYDTLKDSLNSQQKDFAIKDIEIKYQVERKEAENTILKEQEAKDKEIIKKRNILTGFIATGLLLVLIVTLVLYLLNNHKKKTNITLTSKNSEINQQKEELTTQAESLKIINDTLTSKNSEINQQKEELTAQAESLQTAYETLMTKNGKINEQKKVLTEQADSLELANKAITQQSQEIEKAHNRIIQSINYAQRIQEAMLPSDSRISKLFSNYFILFKPRDIVSGDFYWVKNLKTNIKGKKQNLIIVAAADGTGHGVPGGFLSTLGISLLNEIVVKQEVQKASQVLEHMRDEIKILLKQSNDTEGQKDGMDVALCVINSDTNEIDFSGANNPLYIIRPTENTTDLYSNNQKMESVFGSKEEGRGFIIKPDFQPVGIYFVEKEFTNHKIQLQKGDSIYMFSDGYVDQFGGVKRKKFRSKKLQELLIKIYTESMPNQKKILDDTIENWRGDFRQIDDILLMGIKV